MYEEILGNTPVVRLKNLFPNNNIYAKLEYYNPTFSIKDRAAYNMVYEGIKRGKIKKGDILVEASSGNTGLGLCYAAIQFGLKLIVTVFEDVPKEKINLLKGFGATIVICSNDYPSSSDNGYVGMAKKIAKKLDNAVYIDQFNNPDNVLAHYKYTGPELLQQLNHNIKYFFSTIGTGGTILGIGKFLKEFDKEICVIGVEPIGGIYKSNFYGKEEVYKDHLIQSISDDFVSKNFHKEYVDDIIQVDDRDSFAMCYYLMQNEGLCVGTSGGCVIEGISRYLSTHKIDKLEKVACIIPDCGLKYMDTLFNKEYLIKNKINIQPKSSRKNEWVDYLYECLPKAKLIE